VETERAMGKALNIKNAETHELVAELARRTGTSMAEAVNAAVREKLSRLEEERRAALEAWIKDLEAHRLPDDFVLERDTSVWPAKIIFE
jgi:hypothetical protein